MDRSRSLSGIVTDAERFAALSAVGGKAWSLPQIIEHLALAISSTAQPPAPPYPPAAWVKLSALHRLHKRVMKLGLLATGIFPHEAPAPEFTKPRSDVDTAAALERLRAAVAAFDARLAESGMWAHHPILGPMTGSDWRRFHLMHARHHFSFLRVPAPG